MNRLRLDGEIQQIQRHPSGHTTSQLTLFCCCCFAAAARRSPDQLIYNIVWNRCSSIAADAPAVLVDDQSAAINSKL